MPANEGPRKNKPKIACIPCAKGKRSCSGTQPCERCQRLGKPCAYPDEATRTRVRRRTRTRVTVELTRHASANGGFVFGAPAPTLLSLPRQLFPWQDIRLHTAAVAAHPTAGHAAVDAGDASVRDAARAGGVPGEHGAEGSGLTGADMSHVVTGHDKEAYLKYLWDTALAHDVQHATEHEDGEHSDGESEDGEQWSDGSDSPAPTRNPGRTRGIRRVYRNDDGGSDTEDLAGAAAAAGKRTATTTSTLADAPWEGKRARFSAEPVVISKPALMDSSFASLQLQEMAAVARVMDGAAPAWVAVFDTESPFSLQKLVCNQGCLELFGWSQMEVNLRVNLMHVLRWIHPEDVLVRSVMAVNARRGSLSSYSFQGRFLSRKAGTTIPHHALRAIAAAVKHRSSLGQMSGPAGAPAVGTDGLPVSRPKLTAVSSSTGSIFGIDDEDVVSALEEIDDCVTYNVFFATENVQNVYAPSGATFIALTTFTDIDMVRGSAHANSVAAPTAEDDDDYETIVRPVDFDISEERVIMEDDASLLLAAAASAAANNAKLNAMVGRSGTPTLMASATLFPFVSAPNTAVSATTSPPMLPIVTSLRSQEERSITTNLILLRDASVDSGHPAEPVVNPFGE